jgi:hypothetical protein
VLGRDASNPLTFSIRRLEVKPSSSSFSVIKKSIAGPCFSLGSALQASHHGVRRMKQNNLQHALNRLARDHRG